MNLTKYKTAIFDCDGVILQSNQLKTAAFREALAGEPPELVEEFILYHKRNGGISRYVKFKYFYNELKQQQDVQTSVAVAIEQYSELVLQGLIGAELVPGVLETLQYLSMNHVPCYVVSGGYQEELRKVFKLRGLDKYFSGIFGSPDTKKQHLQKMHDKGMITLPAIYFGDAYADYEAAVVNKIDFCYISKCSEWVGGVKFCNNKNAQVYADFQALNALRNESA